MRFMEKTRSYRRIILPIFWVAIIILIVSIVYLSAVTIQKSRYVEGFKCREMTAEARGFWEALGFETVPVAGKCPSISRGHVWLGIIVGDKIYHWESCRLHFMDPYDIYTNIQIRNWERW